MTSIEIRPLFIFPGQGAQFVGMGADLMRYECAKRIYNRANDVLRYNLRELSFNGPQDELDKTQRTQPALLVHSIACLEVFKELTEGKVLPRILAGHSLGEYTALVAGGYLELEDALPLVEARANCMATHGKGHLVAYRLSADQIRPLAEKYHCGIGGCNIPDQTVVGGSDEDLRLLESCVQEQLGTRGVLISKQGAFHTYLMTRAAEEFRQYLDRANFAVKGTRVMSNFSGDYHKEDAESIKSALFYQIFHPVRWVYEIRQALEDGANIIAEFGGGIGVSKKPNLEGITKKLLRESEKHALYLPANNAVALEEAAKFFRSVSKIEGDSSRRYDSGQHHNLLLPVINGMVTENCVPVLVRLDELKINVPFNLFGQPAEENLAQLVYVYAQSGAERKTARPEPFVELSYVGEGGVFVFRVGQQRVIYELGQWESDNTLLLIKQILSSLHGGEGASGEHRVEE